MTKTACENCPARFDIPPVSLNVVYPPFDGFANLISPMDMAIGEARDRFGQNCAGPVEVSEKTLEIHLFPPSVAIKPVLKTRCRFMHPITTEPQPATAKE
jgi:hypothetical protein